MPTLNLFEMAALVGIDPAELLEKTKDVQGLPAGEIAHAEKQLEGALAAVDFTADAVAIGAYGNLPPGVHRVRRHAWGHALGVKIPWVKSSE